MSRVRSTIEYLIRTRPLGCGCLLFMALTALFLRVPLWVKAVCALCALFLLLPAALLLSAKKKKAFGTPALVAAILLLASLAVGVLHYDLTAKQAVFAASSGERVAVSGYVSKELSRSSYSTLCEFRVRTIGGKRVFGCTALAEFPGDETPPVFALVEGEARFDPIENDDPSFNSAGYCLGKAILTVMSPEDCRLTGQAVVTPERAFHALRSAISSYLSGSMNETAEGLTHVLLFGNRSGLSDTLRRDLRFLGLSHLLAVSGMHLSVLVSFFSFLLRRLRAPGRLRCVLLAAIVLLYMTLCAFALSVVRAGIMLLIVLCAEFLNEKSDGLTALLFAGGLIALFSPFSLFDAGFLMSFFATAGILVSDRLLTDGRRSRRFPYFLRLIFVSVAAQIAVLPFSLLYYRGYSVLSPVSTLLFSPLFAAIIYTLPFVLAILKVPVISAVIITTYENLCRLFTLAASPARYVKELYLSVPTVGAILFLLAAAALCAYFFFCRKKRRAFLFIVCAYLTFSVVFFVFVRVTPTAAVFSGEGTNDLLVLSGKGKTCIVDLSDGSLRAVRAGVSLAAEECFDQSPDILMLTHYHENHLLSVPWLLDNRYPETVLLPAPDEENASEKECCAALRALCGERGIETLIYGKDDAFSVLGVGLRSYVRERLKRSTHPVISFELSLRGKSVLYLSRSAHEAVAVSSADAVYIGRHGPVNKEALPDGLKSAPLFFASEEDRAILFAGKENAPLPRGFKYVRRRR